MNLQRFVGFAVLLAGPGAAGASSDVAPGTPPAAPEPAVMARSGWMSMDQAVKMAEQRFHARVVKAATERDNGRTVYVLRLLDESGRVWTVRVDAANGALL